MSKLNLESCTSIFFNFLFILDNFDSIGKGNKVKEIILAMHEAGLCNAKIKSLNLDVEL